MKTRHWCALFVMLSAGWTGMTAQDFDSLVPGASTAAPAPRPSPQAPRRAAPRPSRRAATAPDPPPPQAARPPARPSAPIGIVASVDRTAVWLGEPLVYTVDITCPPGTDILADDLSRDRLRPTGLEVVDALQTRTVDDDGTIRYRSQVTLVSYTIGDVPARLEPQSIRYYVHTAGQATDTLVPADEIALAPVSVAVRSVIPDNSITWIRDVRPVAAMPALFEWFVPVGVLIGAVSVAPLGWAAFGLVRRHLPAQPARVGTSATTYRTRIEEARVQGATGDIEGRLAAFATLSGVIRERLTDLGLNGASLTPDEIAAALATKAPALAGLELPSILRLCERALYGGADHVPLASDVPAAADTAEQLLAARTR